MERLNEFISSFSLAIEVFKHNAEQDNSVRILTHNDADGVASGGILSKASKRYGVPFKITVEKRLDDIVLHSVAEEKPSLLIFSDFGSGYLSQIGKAFPDTDILILDHHLSIGDNPHKVIQINPLIQGIDGARLIAASGICYLFAKTLDEKNIDLAPLGILGALGDQQDKGPKKSLMGINTLIEDEAEKAGLLSREVDLIFYGHETRPLAKAIANTTSPFIPGLSGQEDNCVAFLNHIGIEFKLGERIKALKDLTDIERKKLFSTISSHMISQGCDSSSVHNLIGTVYTLKAEEPHTPLRDGREFASLLNACARMRRPSLGLSICLGDRKEAMIEAEKTFDEYRRKIGVYLEWARHGDRINELSTIYVLQAGSDIDENIIGVVSSILLGQGMLKSTKPIISAANSDGGTTKISARIAEGTRHLGLHLGKIMQEASEGFNGAGGGHDIAAGAFIPQGNVDAFMRRVDELVAKQLNIKS